MLNIRIKIWRRSLKLLACNEYKTNDCLNFPYMTKALPPLQRDKQDVPYYVDSLFTNIPLQEAIDYIIHKIMKIF